MILRLRHWSLILSIIVLLSGTLLAGSIQNGSGTIEVVEVDFKDASGANIHSTLQRPVYATESSPLPGVVVIHGSLQCKEWLMAFGIELARRGFVVLTIDANGHGNSDGGSGAGTAALDYLVTLPFVDTTQIGIVGHSMGGGIARVAISQSSVHVNALVLVGSSISNRTYPSNSTYPRNLLIAVGSFDSLSTYPSDLTQLEPVFGVSDIQPGVVYGSFSNGTARKIVIARTNHLFETIDPVLLSATVDWMKEALKGGIEDTHWIPASDLIYGWWIVGGLVATLGVVLSIFPLMTLLIDLPMFSSLRHEPDTQYSASRKRYLRLGALYGLIGVGLFFPLLALGSILQVVIPFPQYPGLPLIAWLLGSAAVSAFVLSRVIRDKGMGVTSLRELLRFPVGTESSVRQFIRTLLFAIIVIVWLYLWTLLLDLGLALDFRFFLPGMNDLTVARAIISPLYIVVFFIYSLVEGLWLMGILRPAQQQPWFRGQAIWSLSTIFIKCVPYFILLCIEFFGGLILGLPVIPSLIGYTFLFFYAFTPWFAVACVITTWCYRETNNYFLGASINGILFGWIMATILAFL